MKKLILLIIISVSFFSSSNSLYAQSEVDLYLDHINVYVSPYGRIAIFSLPDTIRQTWRTALLVGTGPENVFDLTNDTDVEDSTRLIVSPQFGDYEIYGSYNNYGSAVPPNVLQKQSVYCWQNMNSFIVKYTIINREVAPINAICGLEILAEVEGSYNGEDTVTYSDITKVITDKKTEAIGFKSLSEDFKSMGAFVWYDDYEADTTFYNWLTYDSFLSPFIIDTTDPVVDDPVIIPAYNSKTIASGDSVIIYFAIAYGATESAMLASILQAQEKYDLLTSVESDYNKIPTDYVLDQNYPNPFNPSTKISFGLPHSSNVALKVFNLLGEEVTELVNESLEAGTHTYNFDASQLTSGIYIYSLQTDAGVFSKKMTLIK